MKKVISIVCLCLVASLLLCSCGEVKQKVSSDYTFTKTLPDGYPVEGVDEVVTVWTNIFPGALSTAANMAELPFGIEREKQTGIKVEYIHPAQGQEGTQFNLMVASGTLPDVVQYNWLSYPGGPDAAIEEGLILPLNSIIENGGAPALKELYDEFPEFATQLKTDTGNYYAFPYVVRPEDAIMTTSNGAMIRKDLLDKAGLPVPETVEELETALVAFKEMGVEAPLIYNPYNLTVDYIPVIISGFGINGGLYVDEDEIKLGTLQPEFKAFAETLHKWYEMGILDEEFAVENNKRRDSMFVSGQVGVCVSSVGDFGKLNPLLEENIPEAEMVALPYLTHAKGQKAEFGHTYNLVRPYAAISTNAKNPELAAKLLDYAYTEEGNLLHNFGIEGESYTVENGVPTYTDMMYDAQKNGGLDISETIQAYCGRQGNHAYISDRGYLNGYYRHPWQMETLEMWADTNGPAHFLPIMYMTAEENAEFSSIKTDVDTYREEMLYKFINGTESFDNYDKFIETLKGMGAERMIEIQQQAYDRYAKKMKEAK